MRENILYNHTYYFLVDYILYIYVDELSPETALEKIVALNKKIKAKGKNLDLIGYNEKINQRLNKYFKVLGL